ncbi:MAG TPA: ornithine cyclodeaminase [Thermomicrobiales bacterium]|nr:ornithine cyclodeaminase [Thermomicrobiales bacterium]
MLVLTRADLKNLVPMHEAVDLMKTAFTELSAGRAVVPMRTVLEIEPETSSTLVMPAYLPGVGALGFKVISIFTKNPARGLPTGNAMVCMLDEETGVPKALLNGAFLTALRTGAVSGAATDLLARKDARRLTVIGAGVQAVTQAAAVCTVRDIDEVTVVYRSEDSWQRFQEAVKRDWPEIADRITGTTDAEAAVRPADVICAATTSSKPVFKAAWVKPGTHINGVGSFTPEMQEIPAETVTQARVVVDHRESALSEGGDLIIPLRAGAFGEDHIVAELGEVAAGGVTGRTADEEITFFKSVGNAVQDVVVARRAIDLAIERGIGQEISLD